MTNDDNLISDIYGDPYASCVNEAKKHFTTEDAISSSTAQLWIQYNKDMSLIKPVQQRLQARVKTEMPSLMSIYLWHYAPLISFFPKLGKAIKYWFHELGVIDYKEIDARVTDYMERNGFDDMNDTWVLAWSNMRLKNIKPMTEAEIDAIFYEPTDNAIPIIGLPPNDPNAPHPEFIGFKDDGVKIIQPIAECYRCGKGLYTQSQIHKFAGNDEFCKECYDYIDKYEVE